MKTIDKKKMSTRQAGEFDAVKMMREAREKISSETQNMTFSELKEYIEKKMKESKLRPIGK